MNSKEIRQKYLDFFAKRGHAVIPSASLVPENDPTTLFTSSGMQPLVPYLLGEPHPLGKRLVDSQKSFRTDDIEEVGDNRHDTFFEMLGNWSLGDYFKKEQLAWFFEFLTSKTEGVGLDPKRLYVSVFVGDEKNNVPRDNEAVQIWKEIFARFGIEAKDVELITEAQGGELGMQGGRIFYYEAKKNWWSRSGGPDKMPPGEPGGPDSEVFYDFFPELGEKCLMPGFGKYCHPNCDCGRFMEVGNSVFMEYQKQPDGTFKKLPQQNVDFGGGLERISAAAISSPDIFCTDLFQPAIQVLEAASGKNYQATEDKSILKSFRIVADHLRAATFMLAAGVLPANKERGYILRRLLRRAVIHGRQLANNGSGDWLGKVIEAYIEHFGIIYSELKENRTQILEAAKTEQDKFAQTLDKGLKEFEHRIGAGKVTGKDAFDLYQSYGFPWELTEEIVKQRGLEVDRSEFQNEFLKHQELSRTASAGAFKGGLADASEQVTRLHTTHHLLLKALQIVLGGHVKQRGSNITGERLRIDFSHTAKMTEEEKKKVEEIVNQKIAEDLPVTRSVLDKNEAEKLGAEHEFGQKYPDKVSVYSVGPKDAMQDNPKFAEAYSIEFCGGPHVTHTGEIKGTFKIQKEEAVAAGIRRIKGVLE